MKMKILLRWTAKFGEGILKLQDWIFRRVVLTSHFRDLNLYRLTMSHVCDAEHLCQISQSHTGTVVLITESITNE